MCAAAPGEAEVGGRVTQAHTAKGNGRGGGPRSTYISADALCLVCWLSFVEGLGRKKGVVARDGWV